MVSCNINDSLCKAHTCTYIGVTAKINSVCCTVVEL